MMSRDDGHGEGTLLLSVICAENLEVQQSDYYVKCIVNNKTQKTSRSGKGPNIKWDESLSFSIHGASQLKVRVVLHRTLKDKDVYAIERSIESLLVLGVGDVTLPLEKLSSKSTRKDEATLTIRVKMQTQKQAAELIVTKTVKDWDTKKPVSAKAPLRAEKSDTLLHSWGTFLSYLGPAIDKISAISEIHPYAKAAWKVMSLIPEALIKQIKRDEKVGELVDAMKDVYDLVREGEVLHGKGRLVQYFEALLKQTIECGYFVEAYVRDDFGMRTVKSPFKNSDKVIDEMTANFSILKSNFQNHAVLDISIQMYDMTDAIKSLGVTIDLDDISYAGGMEYHESSGCLSSTRTDILDLIKAWVDDTEVEKDDGQRVFFLTGFAGTGKSTIAHSIASYFSDRGQLGSSFFFSRAKPTTSRPDMVFNTIARDLADISAQIKLKLWNVVKDSRSLRKTADVRKQFRYFIEQPTSATTMVKPVLIVIDALDECESEHEKRNELMDIIGKEISGLPSYFRVFLTARDGDEDITKAFKSARYVRSYSMQQIDRTTTDSDIFIFIGSRLSPVVDKLIEVNVRWREELTGLSGGLFIWASTACLFILGGKGRRGVDPRKQLAKLLSLERTKNPLTAIYALYTQILESSFGENEDDDDVMHRFRVVMESILGSYVPISTDAIDDLIGRETESELIVSPLGALLTGLGDRKQPIQMLHTSFRDFLTDANASLKFYVDTRHQHVNMAKSCLELMNSKLKFNICEFDDPFIRYETMEDLPSRVNTAISEALQYACQYWAAHVSQMDAEDFGKIEDGLRRFLFVDRHLLHWIEVMSILKRMDTAADSLRNVLNWLMKNNIDDRDVHIIIYDCLRLLQYVSFPFTQGPLHVYVSAIPFAPAKTMLYHFYKDMNTVGPKFIFGQEHYWTSFLAYLPTDPFGVIRLAFSLDSKRLVGVSNDVLYIWDVATCQAGPLDLPLKLKETYTSKYSSISLSPDKKKVIVASHEQIEIWDLANRASLVCDYSFKPGFECEVPVAFISDNSVVACFYDGNGIKAWIKTSLKEPAIVRDYPARGLVCVALSPNGKYLGCLTGTSVVTIWEVNPEETEYHFAVQQISAGLASEGINALAISCDGSLVATGSVKGSLKLWDAKFKQFICDEHYEGPVHSIIMPNSPNGNTKHFAFIANDTFYVCDVDSRLSYRHQIGFFNMIATISPDETYIVTPSVHGARLWDTRMETNMWRWKGVDADDEDDKVDLLAGEYIRDLVLSSDGVVAGGLSEVAGGVAVWDGIGTGNVTKHILECHEAPITTIKFSSDGRRLVTLDTDDVIGLWTRSEVGLPLNLHRMYTRSEEPQSAAQFIDVADVSATPATSDIGPMDTIEREPYFKYESWSCWVTDSKGKELWWTPEGMRSDTIVQKGKRVAMFYRDWKFLLLFEYMGR